MPDQTTVRRALERAEFVVLQEAYVHTATAAYADLLLPASTWGEKEGSVDCKPRAVARDCGSDAFAQIRDRSTRHCAGRS